MNRSRVWTFVALVLLDLVWFEFVRHRLTDGQQFGPCAIDPFIVSGHAVLRMLSFFTRHWRLTREAAA